MNPKRIGSILSVAALAVAIATSGAVFACEKHADSAAKTAESSGCAKKAEAQVAANGAAEAKPCAKAAESPCCAKAKAAQVAKADAEPAKGESVAQNGDR